jgi:hypothetical protein
MKETGNQCQQHVAETWQDEQAFFVHPCSELWTVTGLICTGFDEHTVL